MRKRNLYGEITGWSLAVIGLLGLFTYLTFTPSPTFADGSPNPDEHRRLSDITKMQEMNAAICYNSEVDDSKMLEDIRDGKKYWVTKLADKNCWMTQNLDLDLKEGTTLTTSNSDVTSDKTISKASNSNGNTIVKEITDITTWKTDGAVANSTAAYYDPGDYVYINSNGERLKNNECTNITDNLSNAKCSPYFVEVENIIDNSNMHYHVGNYYS